MDYVRTKLISLRIIELETNCWLFTGPLTTNGYAQIWVNGRKQFVHRLSYELFVGPLTNFCLHKRFCKHKNCFNPEHLYDGTQSDNRIDEMIVNHQNGFGASINRRNQTHCQRGHEFTSENTRVNHHGRHCRACDKIHNDKRKVKDDD